MNDSSTKPKDQLLKFCPGCGQEINWSPDYRYCLHCGMKLIKFIPKDRIQEWLGIPLTSEEIENMYSSQPIPMTAPQIPSTPIPVSYRPYQRTRRKWKWGAAFGIPILAMIGKLIASLLLLLIYVLIFVDIDSIDIDNIDVFMQEHAFPIIIIELSTQLVFLLIPYLFTAIFHPYQAPKKDRWKSLGIPFGLKGKHWLIEIGIGIGFALVMTGLVYATEWIFGNLTELIFGIPVNSSFAAQVDISSLFSDSIPFIIVYSVLMILSVAPSEEVLFRGFTQKGFQNSFKNPKLGKTMGLILTAIYFTIFHIYQYLFTAPAGLIAPLLFFSFFPYLILSLILGFLYSWRKNLISAITAHAVYNILQYIIFIVILA